jgi:hypothetical protein
MKLKGTVERRMNRQSESLVRWLFFGVLCGLLPLVTRLLIECSTANQGAKPLGSVLERGELLIVATAITADAIGSLVASGPRLKALKLVSGGSCLGVLFCSSLWFAALPRDTGSINTHFVAAGSIIIFLVGLVTGACCKIVAAK